MATTDLSPVSLPASREEIKGYACVACTQRKVRCDKRLPCLACSKSRIQCQYRETPPPQRRKRKIEDPNQALLERLRSHESILRNAGLPFDAFDELDGTPAEYDEGAAKAGEDRSTSLPTGPVEGANVSMRRTPPPRRGVMVYEHGGRRYYEHGLIGALGSEYRKNPLPPPEGTLGTQQETPDMLAASILTGLPLNDLPLTPASTQYQHPPAAAIMTYWSIFMDNVHPLTQVIHPPTIYQTMLDNSPYAPRNTDALRFAIYACAVSSLTDKECQRLFNTTQASLLQAFQSTTRNMLLGSSFLRVPDIDLLRAQVLLMTSLIHNSDTASLWLLLGATVRMAQTQGLHRDGTALGFSPFKTEMRRRLWWYIVSLDSRLTELMGAESCLPKSMDTKLPSNVNDNELRPDMTEPPKDRTGASDMTFCLVRYEVHRFLLYHDPKTYGSNMPQPPPPLVTSNNINPTDDCVNVSGLESFLESKFLRFCDPVVPLHFLTTTMARSTLTKFRQMEHHHRSRPKSGEVTARPASPGQANRTLRIAVRNIQYDILIHSNRSLRGFLWQVHFYFPWGAPIFLLRKLNISQSPSGAEWDDDMQAAWEQIEELYAHHPEYLERDDAIFLVIGDLTLKAWFSQENARRRMSPGQQQHHPHHQPTPAFIAALQTRQAAYSSRNDPNDYSSGGSGGVTGAAAGNAGMMRLSNIQNPEQRMLQFDGINDFDAVASCVDFDMTDPNFIGVDWPSWGDY